MTVIPGPPVAGYYRHFRGDVYFVLRVLADQSNEKHGRIMVLYERLWDKQQMVRELREFNEYVHDDDSQASYMHHLNSEIKDCKKCVPRFSQMTPNQILLYNKLMSGTTTKED